MAEPERQLKLSGEQRREVGNILLDRCRFAIDAASERDELLRYYDDLLEMVGSYDLSGPWKNSCQIEDPLSREQHTMLMARLAQPLQRDILVQVEATAPGDEESARATEAWIAAVWKREGFEEAFRDYLHNGVRDMAGILYAPYVQQIKTKKTLRYWDGESVDPETGEALTIDFIPPGEDALLYQEVEYVEEEVEKQGVEWQALDLIDIYPYPADRTLKTCEGVGVRVMLSAHQLLEGIESRGYDKETVMEMLRQGPGSANQESEDYRDRQNQLDGVTDAAADPLDREFECFEWWGRMPVLLEGDRLKFSTETQQAFVRAMLCPALQCCFLLDKAPYDRAPLFHRSLLPKPNRFYGTGLVQMLEPLQQEITRMTRAVFDAVDFEMQPALVMSAEEYAANEDFSLYPGAKFIEEQQGSIRPLETTKSGLLGMEPLGHTLSRAQSLAAAEGVGQMQTKVRKNMEMQNVLSTADSKYSLYNYNLYAILPELAAWRVQLEIQFNPDFAMELPGVGANVKVTSDDLKKRYQFMVTSLSQDSNPETRAAQTQAKIAVQQGYFTAITNPAMMSFAPQLWHGAKSALQDLGERNPISWIGEEPPPMMQPGMGMLPGQMPGQGLPGMGGGMPQQSPMAGTPPAQLDPLAQQAIQGQLAALNGAAA